MQPDIVQAKPGDLKSIANLIADAFTPLAVAEWLVASDRTRRAVLAANFEIYVDHALAHGILDVTVDGSGTAVWFPRDSNLLPPPEDYDRRLAAACGRWTDRFQVLDDLFDRHHPDQPHYHLAFLAVHPDRQGQGIGSTLLHYRLDTLDRAGISAYLEASSARSRNLYLRHGFRDYGQPFRLPDGPPFWPMWREPARHLPPGADDPAGDRP